MPLGMFSEGLPVPQVEGWTPVGASRLEWGVGNASTDFDLLLLEEILKDNDIPCEFFPHRPNEGFNLGRVMPLGVWLYVPDEYAQRAERLAAELAAAPVVDEGDGDYADEEDDDFDGELDDDLEDDPDDDSADARDEAW